MRSIQHRRIVARAAEHIADARRLIHFGSRIEQAHRDALAALALLARLKSTTEDATASELTGEACLIVAMCLRLRGKLNASDKWLDRAEIQLFAHQSLARSDGLRKSLISEVYNTRSLVALNFAERALPGSVAMYAAVQRRADQQQQFVNWSQADLRPDGNHISEAVNRVADLLALTDSPQRVLQYLSHVNFAQLANDKSDHTRVLTLLFLARNHILAGMLTPGWNFIEQAAALPVSNESVFLQITLQERLSLFHTMRGDPQSARDHQLRADQLRAIERIDELNSSEG